MNPAVFVGILMPLLDERKVRLLGIFSCVCAQACLSTHTKIAPESANGASRQIASARLE
jgi:hypothetical protein